MIKLASKKESFVKRGVILIGYDDEKNPILIEAKTKGLLDKNVLECELEIYKNFQLPVKTVPQAMMSDAEKKVYEIEKTKGKILKTIMRYDETDPKFQKVKNDISTRKLVSEFVGYFDMDAKVEDTEGNEIDSWERWGIKDRTLYGLVEFMIDDKNGMGLSDIEIQNIIEEVSLLRMGKKTKGQSLLDASLNGIEKESQAMLKKVEAELDGKDKI